MIALLQRVTSASVNVEGDCIANIDRGILALIGVQPADNQDSIKKLFHKITHYRIFEDDDNKMNLSVSDISGEILLVPQFTLAADTRKGLRPGFSTAATPALGEKLFLQLVDFAQSQYLPKEPGKIQSGKFGADMQVALVNDGPATFWLEV